MKDLVIVIPIYRNELLESERVSLLTLNKANTKYDVVFICGNSFTNAKQYQDILKNESSVIYFDDEHFVSTEAYSDLLKTKYFYYRFNKYQYMLIYQTDCLMFNIDILEKWINEGFDYVGCPIIANAVDWPSMPVAGNGGLSLRKISTFIKILSDQSIIDELNKNEIYKKYEDVFFIEGITEYYRLDLPDWQDAATLFGWDMNPDILYKKFGRLPALGCHAFMKNLPFWAMYIDYLKNDSLYDEGLKYHKEWYQTYFGSIFKIDR